MHVHFPLCKGIALFLRRSDVSGSGPPGDDVGVVATKGGGLTANSVGLFSVIVGKHIYSTIIDFIITIKPRLM